MVIIDAEDQETPQAVIRLLPEAHVIRQAQPDGVANALLLARPFLDDVVVVTLGDLFLDGTLGAMPARASLVFWRSAPVSETQKNFGISANADGFVSEVIEKPVVVMD